MGFPSADTTSLSDADALIALNASQREVCDDIDMYMTEASTTYSLSSGAGATTFGSVPSDYNSLVVAWIMDNATNTSRVLGRIDRLTHAFKYPPLSSEVGGFPQVLLRWGTALFVRPKTDKAYTLQFDYLKYLADLSASGDHNDLTDQRAPLVIQRAAAWACEELLGGLSRDADDHMKKYDALLMKAHKHNVAERMSGASFRVKPCHTQRRFA